MLDKKRKITAWYRIVHAKQRCEKHNTLGEKYGLVNYNL